MIKKFDKFINEDFASNSFDDIIKPFQYIKTKL